MSELRFQIAATNYVLKDSTADNLNLLVSANRDKFQIEWSGGVPVGFPYGLGAGDLVLVDISDAGYDLDGAGNALREFFVTNPDLRPGVEGIELSWYPMRRVPLTNAAPGVPLYPFYVNEPAFTEFSPTLSNYNIQYERENEQIFFRKKFDGTFKVSKAADYEFLKNLKDTDFQYRIFVKIQRLCGGVWEDEISGFFTIAQATFDLDRCSVEFPIFTTDKYERLLNEESFEINIQNVATKYTAQFNLQTYKNGIKLSDAFAYLLPRYAPQLEKVESVFLDINNPADFVYNANVDLSFVENLLLFDNSDFRFPTAAAAATKTNVTLVQILSTLRILCNAWWLITDSGTLRIEHFEYFTQTDTDLSGKTKVLRNVQKVDIGNLPIAQRFTIKEAETLRFQRGYLINWEDQLKHLNAGGSVKEIRDNVTTTDAAWYNDLFTGAIPGPEPDITSGYFLYNPLQSQLANFPDFDQNTQLLAWDILLSNYYIFDVVGADYVSRTASTGGSNLQQEIYQILTDIQQRRERTVIEGVLFENCCDSFNPIFKVTISDFGGIDVRIGQRAIHNIQSDTIETDIKF